MTVLVGIHVPRVLSGFEDRLKQLCHRFVHRKRREDLLLCSTFLPCANVYERSDKLLYVEVPGLIARIST